MRLDKMQQIVTEQARRTLRAPLGDGDYAERCGRLETSLAALLDLVETGQAYGGPESSRLFAETRERLGLPAVPR